jgi:aryl sulfotransferase
MRARTAAEAPDPAGVLKDPAAFFCRGYSGAGREVLNSAELSRYYMRTARLAPPDLLDWLHRESMASVTGWNRPWRGNWKVNCPRTGTP